MSIMRLEVYESDVTFALIHPTHSHYAATPGLDPHSGPGLFAYVK